MNFFWRTLLRVNLGALIAAAAPAWADDNAQGTSPEGYVTPVANYVYVDGDREKFREDWWREDGWNGGIEDFRLKQTFGKDTVLEIGGHAIYNEEDYALRLELAKPELGFIRGGVSQYRKYFDGTGGFYKPFSTPSFGLGKDLDLDIGNIFFEAGLTLPDLPQVLIGYERQYKNGAKSMVEWGSVSETLTAPPRPVGSLPLGTVTKKIYPAFKDIDETVDIFKADVSHTVANVDIGNQFRFEHYQNSTKRLDDAQLTLPATAPSKTVTVREDFRHDAFSNVFHMESHITDKVYGSLGYLFSTLDGDGDIRLQTVPFTGVRDKNWFANQIDLDQDSHVLNLNLMVGPFAELIGYAGVQAEMTDTEGFTDAILTEIAAGPVVESPNAVIKSSNDKQALEETAGLRFTGIPFTTVYADGRWVQQDIDLRERELEDGSLDGGSAFRRFTDTDVSRQVYTVGFNTSPINRVTLSGRYRRTMKENDYGHEVDERTTAGVLVPNEGYSAFITMQEFTTDEITAKLGWRPCSQFHVAFKYQLVSTEIDTKTAPVTTLGIPGGEVESANYDSTIYSVHATLTPVARMYLSGMFSYQDTRTIAFDNHAHSVITYQGDVYTIVGTAGVAIDNKTDFTAEYTFSLANNYENNGNDNSPKAGFSNNDYGLPLGLENERHGVLATLSRRITENIILRIRYGFYAYYERHAGGVDDYEAHLGSLACTFRF